VSAFEDFRADRSRYTIRSWWLDRTIWGVLAFRLGQWIDESTRSGPRKVLRQVHGVLSMWMTAFSGIEIARGATIGPGLRIVHGHGVVISPGVVIGSHCSILHGVTLGARVGGDAPVLGDDVEIGAYAVIIGNITIGDSAHVGAASVVVDDVPPCANVAGNPARVLRIRGSTVVAGHG
jgi:serine O-acetyltransferase